MVLLVEDEGRGRGLTARKLRELGYTVLESGNAASTMELLEKHRSIRLLLDYF